VTKRNTVEKTMGVRPSGVPQPRDYRLVREKVIKEANLSID